MNAVEMAIFNGFQWQKNGLGRLEANL